MQLKPEDISKIIKDQIKNDNVLSNDIECIVNEIKGSWFLSVKGVDNPLISC